MRISVEHQYCLWWVHRLGNCTGTWDLLWASDGGGGTHHLGCPTSVLALTSGIATCTDRAGKDDGGGRSIPWFNGITNFTPTNYNIYHKNKTIILPYLVLSKWDRKWQWSKCMASSTHDFLQWWKLQERWRWGYRWHCSTSSWSIWLWCETSERCWPPRNVSYPWHRRWCWENENETINFSS